MQEELVSEDIEINEDAKFDTGTTMVYFTYQVYRAIQKVHLLVYIDF